MKKPTPPSLIYRLEGITKICPKCKSSYPKKYYIFGKRYCINPQCENRENPEQLIIVDTYEGEDVWVPIRDLSKEKS